MLTKNNIIKKERKILEGFFNSKFTNIPVIPDWVTEKHIEHWNKNLFHIHYIPAISLNHDLKLPLWQDMPSKFFYKLISEGKLKKNASTLPGKWILIDSRDKPAKKVSWVRVHDVRILEKIGLNPKKRFKKWNKQIHQQEYLTDILCKDGFGSRFCLTISDIDKLKPSILQFLQIDPIKTIRLPYFAEYNYLGNAIYRQWRTTQTWEWLEDVRDDGEHLASGSGSIGILGWDPPEFWSTILTFRPIIEL